MKKSSGKVICILLGSVLMLSVRIASAETTTFDAMVKNQIQRPVGCPDGAYLCGEAVVAGFGPAEFRWFLVSFEPVSASCGDYTAIVTFTLRNGSMLTLDEAGRDCGPGNSFSSYPLHSYGQPQTANGSWVVRDGTGAFTGLTGSGTNTLRITGAHLTAAYTGVLEG